MNVLCAYSQDMNRNMIVNGIYLPQDYSLVEENKQVTTMTVLNIMRGETQSVLREKRREKNPQLGEKEHFLEKVTSKMKPRP